jgi:prophage endopeptidase
MSPLTLYPSLALVALLAVGGFYKYGHSNGWDERDAELQIEIAKKNEEARAKEQALAKAVADKETELRKANHVIDKKQTDLNAAIRAGRVRLPGASCAQASTSAPAAAGDSSQAGSQPDREADADSGARDADQQTLQLIAQIAADGDKAINQLNACIDAYDNMRSIINGDK